MKKTKSFHFLIIDDDPITSSIYRSLLETAGHRTTFFSSSQDALNHVAELNPDCILCDFVMPELDGVELFKAIRALPNMKQPKFIIITGKLFEVDRRHALETGVDGYMTKPVDPNTFVDDVLEILNESMVIQFWGVRGTLPVPGNKTVRYGGNTNCVSLSFAKRNFFIFDAGTGIKELSNYLVNRNQFPMVAKIFITHPHYDHINGIPFFVPLYMPGNEFEMIGTHQGEATIGKLISDQMDSIYFPITIKEFSAKLTFRNIKEETFHIDDLEIQSILLNHPGRCLGFRVQHKEKSFCYITDNELFLEHSPQYNALEVERLIQFISGTDVLVIDTTYTDQQYLKKIGWGHSCVSRVVDVADKAKAKIMCMFHHDPEDFDKEIDMKLKEARALLKLRHSKTRCLAPHEGSKIII